MQVRRWARAHVSGLTVILSVTSLALVFGAVGQVLPVDALPAPEALLAAIPHLNAAISATAIATIAAGYVSIRRGRVRTHRRLMLATTGLFATFLVLYLYRVAIRGPTEFPGPAGVYTIVYLPTLVVHVSLAIVCLPFVFHALLLAETRSVPEIYQTRHRRVGQVAAVLWVVSFSLGIAVYAMLYHLY